MDGDPGVPGEAGELGVPGARGVPGKDVCAQKYITLSKCHNIVVFCVQGRPGVDGIDGFNGTDGTPGGDGIQGPPVRTLFYHLKPVVGSRVSTCTITLFSSLVACQLVTLLNCLLLHCSVSGIAESTINFDPPSPI